MSDLLLQAESLCRQVAARDLGSLAVYVAPLGAIEGSSSSTFACMSTAMDLLLRPFLGSRWTGRGVGILVNLPLLATRYGAATLDVVASVVLHELAHGIERLDRIRGDVLITTPQLDDFGRATTRALLAKDDDDDLGGAKLAKALCASYAAHDDAFVRTVAHLAHRARLLAGICVIPRLCVGWSRRMAPGHYLDVLADEAAECAGMTFDLIAERPAPPAFTDLCRADETALEETITRLRTTAA